jgi:hypothetical protein
MAAAVRLKWQRQCDLWFVFTICRSKPSRVVFDVILCTRSLCFCIQFCYVVGLYNSC